MAEFNQKALAQLLEGPTRRTSWIGTLFQSYLRPIPTNGSVIALAAGGCEELLQLRPFVGEAAKIHAFDIIQPRRFGPEILSFSAAKFHQANIKNVSRVLRLAGGTPDLIICRHPRIFETFKEASGKIEYNEWWLKTLSEYARQIRDKGQMLITTFTEIEQMLLVEEMRKQGLSPSAESNYFAPANLCKVYQFSAETVPTRPDGFTVLI